MSIALVGNTYIECKFVTDTCVSVYKKVGFTPLQVLTEVRSFLQALDSAKCTYVGRLDPMAEGWIYILWSGDMEEKVRLAMQDKVYEVEVLLGVGTDTGDVLGLITDSKKSDILNIDEIVQSSVGDFLYEYPKYSSPNIKKVLAGVEVVERKQKGHIYSIEVLKNEEVVGLERLVDDKLSLCQMDGDFRLEEIKKRWQEFLVEHESGYKMLSLKVACSSGTYMRTLAVELGKKFGVPALAFGIRRVRVG